MSVHRRNGRWEVKNRTGGRGSAWDTRRFDRKSDADAYDREFKRRKALGPVLVRELDRDVLTLRAFVAAGFRTHAATLAPKSRKQYAWALEHHLVELLDEPLVTLDVPRLARHQEHLLSHGRTANTVREAMTRLSGILQVAVEHGHMQGNPARAVRKVRADVKEPVHPLAPVELEALIAGLTGRDRAIVVLGGHLGLRPLEVRQARWGDLRDGVLVVSAARTKRAAARTRVITVPTATMAELKRWRLESGRPGDAQPIVGPMTDRALALWGWKRLAPAVERVTGRHGATLYLLRHTHASACHYAGFTVPEAAARLGHSGQVHLGIYAHVVSALSGRPHHPDLDALIADARAQLAQAAPRSEAASV